jgi:hypothetical protein
MLHKIKIIDRQGSVGHGYYKDNERQIVQINNIHYPTGELIQVLNKNINYVKWLAWFLDFEMWIDDIKWDNKEYLNGIVKNNMDLFHQLKNKCNQ